jgi:hypothetical protein
VIDTHGRTGSIAADAPACLKTALEAWVATFRYSAPAAEEPTVADWMLVTARRGS